MGRGPTAERHRRGRLFGLHRPAPGIVEVAGRSSRIVLGETNGRNGARIDGIAEAFRAGNWTIDLTDRIRDAIWTKLMLNLYSGLLGIVASAPLPEVLANPACAAAARRIIDGGIGIAKAMGCTATPDVEKLLANGRLSRHTPSIVQDLQIGRPMETSRCMRCR